MKLPMLAAGFAALVAVVTVAVVWAAGGLSEDEPAPPGIATAQFPEGVYRYRLNEQDVLRVLANIEPRYLKDAVGTFTWTIRDGTISLYQTDCDCSFHRVSAPYETNGDLITVRWPKLAANGAEFCASDCVETVRWTFEGNALRFVPTSGRAYDLVFWGARKPWIKID
jgi:hypothetical protein